MKYKLIFKHWKTNENIEKIVSKVDFTAKGHRDLFYSHDDNNFIDVIKDTIVSLEPIEGINNKNKKDKK